MGDAPRVVRKTMFELLVEGCLVRVRVRVI